MRVKLVFARGIVGVVRGMPRALNEPLALLLGGVLMASHDRSLALANLKRAFPDWSTARRWRTAGAAYRQMARSLLEFLHMPDYSEAEIRDRVVVDLTGLDRALAAGRGAVLLTGHFGNWEWLARRVAASGHPLAVIYKEPRDAALGARLRQTREACGVRQIEFKDSRATLTWLRNGGVLGIVMDQEPRRAREAVIAPLFGEPTMTHTGPFRLARMVGSPVFTMFARRTGRGRYVSEMVPFELSAATGSEQAALEDATAFNARLESEIRRHPDHWLWMYGRWRRIARQQPTVTA